MQVIERAPIVTAEEGTTVWLLELKRAMFCWDVFNRDMDLCRPKFEKGNDNFMGQI